MREYVAIRIITTVVRHEQVKKIPFVFLYSSEKIHKFKSSQLYYELFIFIDNSYFCNNTSQSHYITFGKEHLTSEPIIS